MVKPIKFDESGDSDDLQSLFDSIASSSSAPTPTAPAASRGADASGDSDDLQALFDTVATQAAEPPAAVKQALPADDVAEGEVAFNRIGHMARQLHDSLRGLGYDKLIEDSARQIPDAQQRLAYIVQMTEQAASRVLNATDIAKPILDEVQDVSAGLAARWDKMFANQYSVEEFKALAADSRAYFHAAPAKVKAANDQLTEIMMAQDFQDLTGQVIRKVVEMAEGLERQLLTVLIEVMPEERKATAPEGLLNGPVINAAGRSDVVTTQTQVDDLLESLGF